MKEVISLIFIALVLLMLAGVLLNLFVVRVLKNDTRKLAVLLLGLLILQFVLGMLANLYANIPSTQPWLVFHRFGYISTHVANGTMLVLLSGIYLTKARKAKEAKHIGLLGHLGIFLAFASGFLFVLAGQNNIFSLTMSLGFIASLLAYAYKAFSHS